jgi:hypothetical protein
MSYVYQPYPRMLYLGSAQAIVLNHDEEQAYLKNGWGNEPGCTGAVEAKPIEPQSIEAQPIELAPIEPKPIEAKPPRLRVNGKFVKKVPHDGA